MKRQHFIGGSDVAAILGLNKFKSPLDVYNSKVNGNNDYTETDYTYWGHVLEPLILKKYQIDSGCKILKTNKRFKHPNYKFLAAQNDAIIKQEGQKFYTEIKTVGSWVFDSWDILPEVYFCQIMHGLDVSGYEKGLFIILELNSRKIHTFNITYDKEYIDEQRQYLLDFWYNHVIPRIPPPYTVKDLQYMDSEKESIIEANSDIVNEIIALKEVRSKIKKLEEDQASHEEKIKLFIGTKEALTLDEKIIATWKTVISRKFNSKAFKENNSDLYEKYLFENKYRNFLIK